MNNNQLPPTGITIRQAKDWTKAWRTKNPDISRAFLIPTTGIIALFKELNVLTLDTTNGNYILNNDNPLEVAIRAYLAIGPSEETAAAGADEEKLVLVGAVKEVNDYQDQVEGSPYTLKVELSGSGAFDLTKPCPRWCDPRSPLNID